MRVPLQGRRVRAWIVADDVTPDTAPDQLRDVLQHVSAGPPPDVVELCRWAAWRWAGSVVPLLRAASPPNVVRAGPAEQETGIYPPGDPPAALTGDADRELVVAWPPLTPRRDLVAWRLAPEGSSLVVVPDRRTAAEIAADLESRGRQVIVLRSDQSDAERSRAWSDARAGACVVVGGRIAALAPVPDLESVIVLDEGDEALREERAPAWGARELVIERARRSAGSVTLVSPAPTVDAVTAVGTPREPSRVETRAGWPRIEIVDRRDDPPGRGWFSDALTEALRAVAPPAIGVCVLNRKGRAALLDCLTCSTPANCERCGAAVVEGDDGLECPQCGTARPRVCLECSGTRFRRRRVGVRRLRDELAALLPRLEVQDVEGSTTAALEGDVLIGTEAVLHRAGAAARPASVVAFLDFDQELLAPRYRSSEQALWLLVRAARLLSARAAGRVLVQTRMPGHEVLTAARDGDPTAARDLDHARRELLAFPPFGGMAELRGAADAVELACAALAGRVTVLGPTASPSGAHALVKAPSTTELCDALHATDFGPARAAGRLRIEVDPLRV